MIWLKAASKNNYCMKNVTRLLFDVRKSWWGFLSIFFVWREWGSFLKADTSRLNSLIKSEN